VQKKHGNNQADILHENIAEDHKINKNAVSDVGRLNFPLINKSVTAEVKKVEIELARSCLCSHCSYLTHKRSSERAWKKHN